MNQRDVTSPCPKPHLEQGEARIPPDVANIDFQYPSFRHKVWG